MSKTASKENEMNTLKFLESELQKLTYQLQNPETQEELDNLLAQQSKVSKDYEVELKAESARQYAFYANSNGMMMGRVDGFTPEMVKAHNIK